MDKITSTFCFLKISSFLQLSFDLVHALRVKLKVHFYSINEIKLFYEFTNEIIFLANEVSFFLKIKKGNI